MKRFRSNMRVKVTERNSTMQGKYLQGKCGLVVRIRRADNGAWVRMDDPLPDYVRSFPENDSEGRGNDIILYPEQCEEI